MIDWNKLKAKPANETRRFTPVVTGSQGPGKRENAGGKLFPAGRFLLNLDGSDLWNFVVRQYKELPPNYIVYYGVMEQAKLVAAYPVPPGTPGCSPIRLTPRESNIQESDVTLYLDGVFTDYPSLRVKGKRKVAVAFERDADGKPYLEINLASQLAIRTTSRKGSGGTEGEDEDEMDPEDEEE